MQDEMTAFDCVPKCVKLTPMDYKLKGTISEYVKGPTN